MAKTGWEKIKNSKIIISNKIDLEDIKKAINIDFIAFLYSLELLT